ncbi:DNA-binding transcriptional MerR regulator [Arthrobacter roseus]|nr:DNA-binding transcriptional MerR regulator [Arthrobacter roseus]
MVHQAADRQEWPISEVAKRILVLRQLGLGLEAIREVLHGQRDEVSVLRVHH